RNRAARTRHTLARENLHLRQRTHVRNLVKKNCPGVREFKFSFHCLLRPSERTFFVTKELTLEQRIAHGRGIERNEWTLGASGGVVNGLRQQRFSGTGLAQQNNWNV